MIQGGKVHYNGQRAKPSKVVEVGATVLLRQGNEEKQVVIESISDKRRGAPEAQLMYQETESSIKRRAQHAELRKLSALNAPHPDKRPDKKQRRELIKAKSQHNGG